MMVFKLNDKEEAAAKEFLQQHRHPEVNKGAIGGHMKFIFTPTALADAYSIHCTICGEEKNITDYTSW